MRSVTVQEAKTQLSALLRAVEAGEQVEICRGRTPVAMLVQRAPHRTLRDLEGVWGDVAPAGLPPVHDHFDRMLVAQALAEDMTIVGGDGVFAAYGVDVLWD